MITTKIVGWVGGLLGLAFALLVGVGANNEFLPLGATPSSGDLPGIYNTTPTDLGLRDGYGSALAVDNAGRLILSPSSTVGGASSLQDVTDVGSVTTDPITAGYYIGSDTTASTFNGPVSSTLFSATDGSAGAPTFNFGNANETTGIYSSGEGIFDITTNGNHVASLTSNGSVGSATFFADLLPDSGATHNIGALATPWEIAYARNVSSTNATTTGLFAQGRGATTAAISMGENTRLHLQAAGSAGWLEASNAVGARFCWSVCSDSTVGSITIDSNGVLTYDALRQVGGVGVNNTFAAATSTFAGSLLVTNASSTFFLSGASALIGTAAPIPTSTSLLLNSIPSQFYAFNASTTNCVYWTPGNLRGAWDAGVIVPQITWSAATGTGAVVWRMTAQSVTDNWYLGTPFTGPYSYATTTLGGGYFQQIDSMDSFTPQNATAGVPIRWEVCRVGGSAGDTLGADAYMVEIKGEYKAESISD